MVCLILKAVNSVSDIIEYFELNKPANVVYVIMAQPMADGASPMCIGTFASDNRGTALDVKRRRAYISNRLAEEHLEMVAYGTDGDTREMKCELESSAVGITLKELSTTLSKESEEFLFFKKCSGLFACAIKHTDLNFQDTIHIATKLRNKFVKHHLIPLGSYAAIPNDLHCLFDQKSEEKIRIRKGVYFLIYQYIDEHFSGLFNTYVPYYFIF